ncbi:MAG: hypothetical protein AB4057_21175 [Crocosphaera sp.]
MIKIIYAFTGISLLLVSSATFAQQISQEVINTLRHNSTIEGYKTYLKKSNHRAFAHSSNGPWGWAADRATQEIAIQDAIRACNQHRERGDAPCKIFSVDGQTKDSINRSPIAQNSNNTVSNGFVQGYLPECYREQDTVICSPVLTPERYQYYIWL